MFKLHAIALLFGLPFMAFSSYAMTAETLEIRSTVNDQKQVAVTIYNNNLALVKDQRKVKLDSGSQKLAIRDVSAQIRPETVLLKSLSHPNSFTTQEQNFDFDLLTPEKLLEKYVGKTVSLVKINPATGEEKSEQALVMSVNNGVVLKIGNRIETGQFFANEGHRRIVFDDIPSTLRDRPTLVTQINNKVTAEQHVELSYLTGGLAWKADYVAELSQNEDRIDLSGWVTLTNTSGASYQNATLQLVAGDVHQVPQSLPQAMNMRKDVIMAEAAAPMAEESLLEYHLYTLDRPTTIAENQTKQVALLNATGIPARKELVLKGADYYYQGSYGDLGNKVKVGVFVEFDNKEASKLGMPLPKGIMRVYKKDTKGNAQFVGEDSIDHTPKNESIRLRLGDSFDVTADRKQTDFKVLPRPAKGNSAFESAYEIKLNNAKKEKVTVTIQEPINGDWTILSESHPHKKENSRLAVWKVDIPADGSTTLTYRTRVKY
jgi:hypothetical protein